MADKYESMTDLMSKAKEGEDWIIETMDNDSDVISMAIHGGGIEAGTTELARLIAEKGGYNMFSFLGIMSSGNTELHVTSTKYNSPQVINKVQDSKHSLSVHGAGGSEPYTYMGGGNTPLKNMIWESLEEAGFECRESPGSLAGVEPMNIANRTSIGMGVQLELSSEQRKNFFEDNNWKRVNREDRDKWTNKIDEYAEAVVKAVNNYLSREISNKSRGVYYPLMSNLNFDEKAY